MKKVIFLMLAMSMSLGLMSCSSDDDSSNEPQFTIQGVWKVSQYFANNVEQDIDDYCAFKGSFQFVAPNVFVENGFEVVEGTTNCVAKTAISGTWVKNNNSYTLTFASGVASTVFPNTFTTITNSSNLNKFEITYTEFGQPRRLVFTKQ